MDNNVGSEPCPHRGVYVVVYNTYTHGGESEGRMTQRYRCRDCNCFLTNIEGQRLMKEKMDKKKNI